MKFIVLTLACVLGFNSFADENCTSAKKTSICTEESVKEQVEWACKLIETKGKDSLAEINTMRFDCCGEPNYVWINDMGPKMIQHPVKKDLNGQDLSNKEDPKGKKLFVEFVNAVKRTPSGAWVDYMWPKYGEKEATPKKSWVKKCTPKGQRDEWVVGSGTWL